jgi:hypothetical protein
VQIRKKKQTVGKVFPVEEDQRICGQTTPTSESMDENRVRFTTTILRVKDRCAIDVHVNVSQTAIGLCFEQAQNIVSFTLCPSPH